MTGLSPRNPNRLSRRGREQRAYRLVLAAGGLGAITVAGLVLAVLTSFPLGVPILAGIGDGGLRLAVPANRFGLTVPSFRSAP